MDKAQEEALRVRREALLADLEKVERELDDKRIRVDGKTLDLSAVTGFTLGDKIALKKKGIELTKLAELSPEQESELVLFVLQKLDPALERKHAEALSLGSAVLVLNQAGEATKVVDRPT